MGWALTNTSLLAPLDVIRFALVYLILVVVPGYALAALTRPHAPRSERAALAIPCGYAIVALSGLCTALTRLPFTLVAYAAIALPITLAWGYVTFKRGNNPKEEQGRWWIIPVGVSVVQVGIIELVYAHATMPSGSDTVSHVMWIDRIARAHVFPIALLSARLGTGDGGFYPPVFHALAALILSVAPMATYHAAFYNVVATIAPLPLALFCYVRVATGSARTGAFAAVASLAFEALPFFVLPQGLYTFTASLLIVPALALALYHALGHGERRAVVLAVVLGVGLFYTHPTEFVTVALLALAIVPAVLHDRRAWTRACGYGVIIAAAWALAAAPALAAVHTTMVSGAGSEIKATGDFSAPPRIDLGAVVDSYVQWVYGHNLSYVLLIAVAGGSLYCLIRRRARGLVAVQILVAALFIDANSYNVLQRFYTLSFPWALWERLAVTHYWLALPLAGIGIDAAVSWIGARLARLDRPFIAIAAAPIVLVGLLLPLDAAGRRASAYAHARDVVTAPDVGALAWLRAHAANALVVNDGDTHDAASFDTPIDAGLWMPALGVAQPLFWRSGGGPGPLDDRFYLLDHIADDPLPPRATAYVGQYHPRYVFYGARVRPGATRHLNLARLLGDPLLRLVYSSSPACHAPAVENARPCPTGQSYIFAFNRTVG